MCWLQVWAVTSCDDELGLTYQQELYEGHVNIIACVNDSMCFNKITKSLSSQVPK